MTCAWGSGMRCRGNILGLLVAWPLAAGTFGFYVVGADPGSWTAVLSSVGLLPSTAAAADVVVVPGGADASVAAWSARVDKGTILVLEGESQLAESFGFRASAKPRMVARSVEDVHAPQTHIVWEKPLELPVTEIPKEARVFAKERWQGAPLIAGLRRGQGAVLWVAGPLGVHGYDRFPYVIHALADLGLDPPFRSDRLWAFFDSAYRSRVDLDYFAGKWRRAGIVRDGGGDPG